MTYDEVLTHFQVKKSSKTRHSASARRMMTSRLPLLSQKDMIPALYTAMQGAVLTMYYRQRA